MPLFGPPNIEKLKAKGNTRGLIRALGYEEDANICQAAAEALDTLGWQPDQSEAAALYWIQKRQWHKCVEIGATAVRPLVAAFRGADESVRQAASEALVQIGEPAVQPLVAALKGADESVRQAASEALVQIGEPAVDALTGGFIHKEQDVRAAALDAVVQIGEPAVGPLTHTFGIIVIGADPNRRILAAEALGRIGAQLEDLALRTKIVELLIAALRDENPLICMVAASGLKNIRDTQAVDALFAAIDDSRCSARWAVASAIGEIGTQTEDAALRARAVESLIPVLKDRSVRYFVVKALGELGDPRAKEPLTAALRDTDKNIREAAEQALDKLI